MLQPLPQNPPLWRQVRQNLLLEITPVAPAYPSAGEGMDLVQVGRILAQASARRRSQEAMSNALRGLK